MKELTLGFIFGFLMTLFIILWVSVANAEVVNAPLACIPYADAQAILLDDGMQQLFVATDIETGVLFQVWVNTNPDNMFFRAFFKLPDGLICQVSRGDLFDIIPLGEDL